MLYITYKEKIAIFKTICNGMNIPFFEYRCYSLKDADIVDKELKKWLTSL